MGILAIGSGWPLGGSGRLPRLVLVCGLALLLAIASSSAHPTIVRAAAPSCQPALLAAPSATAPTTLGTAEEAYHCLLDNYGGAATVLPNALLVGAWTSAMRAAGLAGTPAPQFPTDADAAFQVFRTALGPILDAARDAAARTHILQAAIDGMASTPNDDHTGYLPPPVFQAAVNSLSGQTNTTGLGIHFMADPTSQQIFVFSLVTPGPAASAGIKPGDILKALNGSSLSSLLATADVSPGEYADGLSEAVVPAGRAVRLDLLRPPANAALSITVTSGPVTMADVEGGVIAGNVGYVHIWSFSADAADRVRRLLSNETAQHVRRIMLDVRGNPGGSIQTATDIISLFTHHDPLALFRDQDGTSPLDPDTDVPLIGLPVTVLVDGGSASAAELVAAALQDAHVGSIVGSRTSGDIGTAVLFQLDDGSGLEITISQLLRANGQSIDGVGVVPNVVASTTPAAAAAGHDTTLEQALALPTVPNTSNVGRPLPAGHWVETFVPSAQLWSGSDGRAVSFGPSPQWTHFLVVAPQQGPRLYVYDLRTDNYAWIDAADVGPSGPPDNVAAARAARGALPLVAVPPALR